MWADKSLDEPTKAPHARVIRRPSILDVVKTRSRSKPLFSTMAIIVERGTKPHIVSESATLTRDSLLSQLHYDPKVTGADIVTNYEIGRDLSKDDQERSLHVIKSKVLADWV